MKRPSLIICLLFICSICIAQEFNDSLYQHIYQFQFRSGAIEDSSKVNLKDLSETFYVGDLVEDTNTGTFRLYVFYRKFYYPIIEHYVIVNNDGYQLYDQRLFHHVILRILDSDEDISKKDSWIRAIIRNYERNGLYDIILSWKEDNFEYFIPIDTNKE